jgi:flagellar basal-body rod modification protein FlgD
MTTPITSTAASSAASQLTNNFASTLNSVGQSLGSATTTTATLGNTDPKFNQFLTLLTAQLKYQDPMSPTDPTAFVAQLAQFSQVEQQTKTNTLITQLTSALSGNSLSQTAALIGKQVNASAASLTVPTSGSSAPTTFAVTQTSLKNPRLVIMDQNGTALRSLAVATGQTSLTFDGLLANGQRLPAGSYAVKLVGDDSAGKEQVAGTISAKGQVTEVLTKAGGGYTLLLDDGSEIDASSVTSLSN